MAFRGYTRDLGSFGEETNKTTTPPTLMMILRTMSGDGVAIPCDGVRMYKRRRQDFPELTLPSYVS
ncbi:hypothetical protein Tco_0083196, partial [Tanacetum coccineum]